MRAGTLNKRCEILRPDRVTNKIGESIITWKLVKRVRASAWTVQASERNGLAGVSEVVRFEVRIRRKAFPELTADHRLVIDGRTLEITGILTLGNTEEESWRIMAVDV